MSYKGTINNLYRLAAEKTMIENIELVEKINQELQENVNRINDILQDVELIEFDPEEYYNSLYKSSLIDEYTPLVMETEKRIKKRMHYIKENKFLERMNPKRKEKREERNNQYQSELERIQIDYKKAEDNNKAKYEKYVSEIKKNDDEYNKKIDQRKQNYYNGENKEVISIYKRIMTELQPPVDSIKFINFSYDNKKAQLNLEFLNPLTELERTKEVKYIKSKWAVKNVEYTEAEFEKIYEKLVCGSLLYVVSKIWFFLESTIKEMIVNGYVHKLNPATGNEEDFNFISVKLYDGDIPFDKLDLLDAKMFLDSKKARYKMPLIEIKKINKYEFNNGTTINTIDDDLDGLEFEKISKALLEKNGFEKVVVTQASGDYGADIIAYKDSIKYAIQCKKYSSKVGVRAVQEVIASKSMYKCHVGVVLTNNFFTPNAEKLAESNGILLWDKTKLQELVKNADLLSKTND